MERNSNCNQFGNYEKITDMYLVSDGKITTYIFGYDDTKDDFVIIQFDSSDLFGSSGLIEIPNTEENIKILNAEKYVNMGEYLPCIQRFSNLKTLQSIQSESLSNDKIEELNNIRENLLSIVWR